MPRKPAKKSNKVRKQRRKSKSWKKVGVGAKVKKSIKLLTLSIFSISFAVLIILLFSFYKFIGKPFASTPLSVNALKLSSENQFALAFVVIDDIENDASNIKQLVFVAGDPIEKTLSFYTVPPQLEIDLPQRYGIAKIEKAYALGELVGESGGVGLTTKTLEKIFARKIDRYFVIDEAGYSKVDDSVDASNLNLQDFGRLPSLILSIRENVITNINSSDLLFLGKFFYELKGANPTEITIKQSDLFDTTRLDNHMNEDFLNLEVINERKRIFVLNGTDIPGLGGFASRSISNFGGSISGVDNAYGRYDESFIISRDSASKTLDQVVYQTGITKIIPGNFDEKDIGADITVVVGIDYSDNL